MRFWTPFLVSPLLALTGCEAFGRPSAPSDRDIEAFERGFASSCAAGFPHAAEKEAAAACRCMLQALYGQESPAAVLPRIRQAGHAGLPADLDARVMASRVQCAGKVIEAEYAAGCAEGCAGSDATMASACGALCNCLVTKLKDAHPGDAGAEWLLKNAWVEPTESGNVEVGAARKACTPATQR
jgi:hypothetical protein